jgi:O-succinylbenzoic acid--CoA ligase
MGSGRSWTREELAHEVDRRAAQLSAQLRPGDIRTCSLQTDPQGVVELLATWSVGAVAAPLPSRITATEAEQARSELEKARRERWLPPGSVAVLWTSGTSGAPRGVALTEHGLRASATASSHRLSLSPSDVWFASLSLGHVGGLALVTRALMLGAPLVAPGAFAVEDLVDGIRNGTEAGPLTHVSLVPTQLLRLLDRWGGTPPPDSFRCALVGGAATPEPLLTRALESGWPLALTYGMTEMTSQVATAAPPHVRAKPGSVGAPLPGVELRIEADGEVLVRGTPRAAGYVATEEPLVDDHGWYHTGDLGRLDSDGDLWIVGRRSDRIMSGGVTVDPHEVEAVLRQHPQVRDACVVGLPDEEWGERVAALLVLAHTGGEDGEADPPGDDTLRLERLEDWAAGRLGAARRPRAWATADVLPLNANGKLDRASVRARFTGG